MAKRLSAIPRIHEAGSLRLVSAAIARDESPLLLKTSLPVRKIAERLTNGRAKTQYSGQPFRAQRVALFQGEPVYPGLTPDRVQMYHQVMYPILRKVAKFISKEDLLRPGDRVGLAVSGGADSVAMLRLMLELRQKLGIVLVTIHFNHKLRGDDSDADEKFVRDLSRQHGLDCFSSSGEAASYSEQNHLSLEAAARSLRYEFFRSAMGNARLSCVATAHTLDDQAETVLLKLARGSGTRGLAAIYPKLKIENLPLNESANCQTNGFIIRPLLATSRNDIELYLRSLGQSWREDKSNRDLRHSRNLIRHGVMPRLRRNLNPAISEALAETANIARAEEEYWDAEIAEILPTLIRRNSKGAAKNAVTLDAPLLLSRPLALQRRLLRAVSCSRELNLEFNHVERILDLVSGRNRIHSTALPKSWLARRIAETITLFPPSSAAKPSYEYKLPIPGRIEVPEAGMTIEAALIRPGNKSAYNSDQAIDPQLVASELYVRNWRFGDRFWPGHTKSPKKIKELLQQRRITGPDRKQVPVVVSGGEVIWMEGFPAPGALKPKNAEREVLIIRVSAIS